MFDTCNRNECSPLIPECLVHVGLHSFLLHVPNILGSMGCTHSCYMYQTFRMFDTCNRNECSPLVPECLIHVTGMSAAHWSQNVWYPVTCIKHSGINGLHSFLLHVSNILGSMGCTHSCTCIKHSVFRVQPIDTGMFGKCNRNECSPLVPECLVHVTGMSAAHWFQNVWYM
jgi:hypothetical protein